MAECDDGETSGGYDHTFVGNVEKYECTICMLVMRDPQLIVSCGQHSFCGTCLNKWIKTSAKPLVCPSDKIEFDQSKVVADARLAREIHDLRVYCQYDTQGCTETPELRDLQEHLDKCKFAPIEQLRNENRNLREALGKLTVENKELLDNVQRLNNEITTEKERLNNEIKTEKEKLTKVTEDNHKLRNKIIKRDDSIATLTNTATNKNQESRDKMRELGEKIRLLNIELKFVNKEKEKQNEIEGIKHALTSLAQSCDMKPAQDLLRLLSAQVQKDQGLVSLQNKIDAMKHALILLTCSKEIKPMQDLIKEMSEEVQSLQSNTMSVTNTSLDSYASHIGNNYFRYGMESLDDGSLLQLRVVVRKYMKREVLSRFYTEGGYRMCLTVEWHDPGASWQDDSDSEDGYSVYHRYDSPCFLVACCLNVGENDDIIPWPYIGHECLLLKDAETNTKICESIPESGTTGPIALGKRRPLYSANVEGSLLRALVFHDTQKTHHVLDIIVMHDRIGMHERGFKHKVEFVNDAIKMSREGSSNFTTLLYFNKVINSCTVVYVIGVIGTGVITCIGNAVNMFGDRLHTLGESLHEFFHNYTSNCASNSSWL